MKACRNCGSTEGWVEEITVAEAAIKIGVSRQAVAQLIDRGEIKARLQESGRGNPGGRAKLLIPVDDIDGFIARRKRPKAKVKGKAS